MRANEIPRIAEGFTLSAMPEFADRKLVLWALVGDVLVLAAVTVVGFATHGTLDETTRVIVTSLGVLVAWGIVGPWFDAFSTAVLTRPLSVWRVALAWAIAAPVAGFLRGWILGLVVSPTFILVIIAVNGSVLVIWRLAYATLHRLP